MDGSLLVEGTIYLAPGVEISGFPKEGDEPGIHTLQVGAESSPAGFRVVGPTNLTAQVHANTLHVANTVQLGAGGAVFLGSVDELPYNHTTRPCLDDEDGLLVNMGSSCRALYMMIAGDCSVLLSTMRNDAPPDLPIGEVCRKLCGACIDEAPDWSHVQDVWIRGDVHVVSQTTEIGVTGRDRLDVVSTSWFHGASALLGNVTVGSPGGRLRRGISVILPTSILVYMENTYKRNI
jgi:hypothetical protein